MNSLQVAKAFLEVQGVFSKILGGAAKAISRSSRKCIPNIEGHVRTRLTISVNEGINNKSKTFNKMADNDTNELVSGSRSLRGVDATTALEPF